MCRVAVGKGTKEAARSSAGSRVKVEREAHLKCGPPFPPSSTALGPALPLLAGGCGCGAAVALSPSGFGRSGGQDEPARCGEAQGYHCLSGLYIKSHKAAGGAGAPGSNLRGLLDFTSCFHAAPLRRCEAGKEALAQFTCRSSLGSRTLLVGK